MLVTKLGSICILKHTYQFHCNVNYSTRKLMFKPDIHDHGHGHTDDLVQHASCPTREIFQHASCPVREWSSVCARACINPKAWRECLCLHAQVCAYACVCAIVSDTV